VLTVCRQAGSQQGIGLWVKLLRGRTRGVADGCVALIPKCRAQRRYRNTVLYQTENVKGRKQLPLYPERCCEIDRFLDDGFQRCRVEGGIETGLYNGIGRVWDQSHGDPVLPYGSKTHMLGWFGVATLDTTWHGSARDA